MGPVPRVLLALDVERIQYSSLTRDFVVIDEPLAPANFSVSNVTEVRAGSEFAVKNGRTQVFLRAGVFTSPDHTLRFVPTGELSASQVTLYNDLFNLLPRKTKILPTVGVGLVFGRRLQVDLAYAGSFLSYSFMVRLR